MDSQLNATAKRLSLDELPEFSSSNELERVFGVPASTFRYWAATGQGPTSCKLGRRRVWRKASVLAWLEAQEAASSP